MMTYNLNRKTGRFTGAITLALSFLTVPLVGQSAVPEIYGSLSNFDAANFETVDTHGFDIQLEGMQPNDFWPSYPNKYGQGQNSAFTDPVTGISGTIVRYQSPKDPVTGAFLMRTVPHDPNTAFNGTCYVPTNNQAGCDHFGVHPKVWNPALNSVMAITGQQAVYHWLIEDVNNPGELVRVQNGVMVPTPFFYFAPPAPTALPSTPPVLVAVVQLPPPPPAPVAQYGNATWVKVFKSELNRPVDLAELVTTVNDASGNPILDANGVVQPNPVVPQDPAVPELNWTVVQTSPPSDSNGNHRQRGRVELGGTPKGGSKAVIRRYETYAYTGAYDPITHEALCAGDPANPANLPLSCNAPTPGELGAMQVAQMVAANIVVPSITVTVNGSGKGSITSADKVIDCPSKACTSPYTSTPPAADPIVRLTANVSSGSIFAGWSGSATADACGTNLTCDVTVAAQEVITATFKNVYSVGAATSNPGSVTATSGGNTVLNCGLTGKICSAKVSDGTGLLFTAIPPAGKTFLGWSGDASSCGLTANCMLTVGGNQSAKASFSK